MLSRTLTLYLVFSEPRIGINEDTMNVTDSPYYMIIAVYAVARLSCIDCKNIFHVNVLDNGPRTK